MAQGRTREVHCVGRLQKTQPLYVALLSIFLLVFSLVFPLSLFLLLFSSFSPTLFLRNAQKETVTLSSFGKSRAGGRLCHMGLDLTTRDPGYVVSVDQGLVVALQLEKTSFCRDGWGLKRQPKSPSEAATYSGAQSCLFFASCMCVSLFAVVWK